MDSAITVRCPWPDASWLKEHHFQGHPVLPAVIAMQMLRHTVNRMALDCNPNAMTEGLFDKFLYLFQPVDNRDNRPSELEIEVYPHSQDSQAGWAASLYSRIRLAAGMARRKRHVRLVFANNQPRERASSDLSCPASKPENAPMASYRNNSEPAEFIVLPDQIYRELVPLGPVFQNISGPLALFSDGARAPLRAGTWPGPISYFKGDCKGPLKNSLSDAAGNCLDMAESPFVLDAAMHAACVWSQRYAHCVAFPVGFDDRRVYRPCRFRNPYTAHIQYCQTRQRELFFDVLIVDDQNNLCELVRNLKMRDVSGGRWLPPAWIKA